MTYADLRAAIQADLAGRVDLIPQVIDNEVSQAVFLYNAENFGSMADTDRSIITTPGVSEYPLPQYTIMVTGMWFLLGGTTWIKLIQHDYEELVDLDDIEPTTQSPPDWYAIYGDKFKLYETPDNQYPLKILRTAQIPSPSTDDAVQNFWTNDGFGLIRYATDARLCRAYLNLPSMADEYDAMAARELQRLNFESEIKQSKGLITPHMR